MIFARRGYTVKVSREPAAGPSPYAFDRRAATGPDRFFDRRAATGTDGDDVISARRIDYVAVKKFKRARVNALCAATGTAGDAMRFLPGAGIR